MGTKKRKRRSSTTKEKKEVTQKKSNFIDYDIAFIIVMVLGVLLFLLIYAEAGSIGTVLSPMLGGIIGKIKYLVPIGFLELQ